MKDDALERGLREMRDGYDGSSPHEDETLARIFETLDAQRAEPQARVLPWRTSSAKRTLLRTTIALAATFALTTAWAAGTGRLAQFFADAPSEPHESPIAPQPSAAKTALGAAPEATTKLDAPAQAEDPTPGETAALPPAPDAAPTPAPSQPADATPSTLQAPAVALPSLPTAPAAAAATHVATPGSAHAARTTPHAEQPATNGAHGSLAKDALADATPSPSVPTSAPTPSEATSAELAKPSAPSPDQSYERAHKLHFGGDYAAALGAWDDYLRESPTGRFAPEARFNRAIALWKLGRRDEAARALEPFARGAYGEYRREEARRLLEAAGR